MQDIKKKMKGAFDLLFLFGKGIDAFEGTKEKAIKSFLIPVVVTLIALPTCVIYPPRGMEKGFSNEAILLTVSAQVVLSTIFGFAVVAAIAMGIKRFDKFWLFFEACNWVCLAFFLATLPLQVASLFEPDMRDTFDRIFGIVTCYGYIVTGCVAFRAFKLNWQLAAAIAIATLFVNEQVWNFLFALQNIPDPWG